MTHDGGVRSPLPLLTLLGALALTTSACTASTASTAASSRPASTPGSSAPATATAASTPAPASGSFSPPAEAMPAGSATMSPTVSAPAPSSMVPSEVRAGPAPAGTFVLGDSIILGAGVGPRLADYGYTVVGVVGQSATEDYLRTHLSSPAAQSARSWVIELGTNNTGDDADIGRLERLVEVVDSLRTAQARQRVYWVTPYRPSTYTGSKSRYSLDPFIAELARLAGERPWLRLIDWAGTARFNEDWFADDGMHLHPNATGQAVLLAMIAGPDARPVTTPSPLLTGAPSSSRTAPPAPEQAPEPEVFDNSTLPPASTPAATAAATEPPASPVDPLASPTPSG